MLYREIIAVCSQIHTKPTNTLWGQKVELLNVKSIFTSSKQQVLNSQSLSAARYRLANFY